MLTRHTDRTRYGQEDEDIAYRLQIIGAREGAIRGTLVAGAAVALWGFSSSRSSKSSSERRSKADLRLYVGLQGELAPLNLHSFPLVRRQTLAGKAFLVSWGTIFGVRCLSSHHYLLKWEQDHRIQAERWRDMARRELSAKGIIASETTMQKWKADFDLKNSSSAVLSPATSTSPAPQVGESRTLEELRQVQA
ncbi:RHTO0S05e08702g1_1 [Rhodotorula toruloides]|uniref:RHTO0S05e08702g1_1 n=1 Tax=Rhodotorula toruloides TaxID=5286 RepID=A0A061ATK2_RHOTO|nr:RHTO0S05e08702g1_1 [Rhodotorula toruloides]